MGNHPEPGTYRIYVLTIWKREGDSDGLRFVIEDPRSGIRTGFTSADALIDRLLEIAGTGTADCGRQEVDPSGPSDDSSATSPDC